MLRTYFKPFFKSKRLKQMMERVLRRKFLYNVGRAGIKNIKKMQKKTSKRGVRIRKGLYFTVGAKSVTFYMNAIGKYQNEGVRRHKMRYLAKAKRPIPIMKDGKILKEGGKPVFRWASPRSMAKPGSWTSPGWKAKKFFEEGIAAGKAEFKKKIAKEINKYTKKK